MESPLQQPESWDSLVQYYEEIDSLRAEVRRLGGTSRGMEWFFKKEDELKEKISVLFRGQEAGSIAAAHVLMGSTVSREDEEMQGLVTKKDYPGNLVKEHYEGLLKELKGA